MSSQNVSAKSIVLELMDIYTEKQRVVSRVTGAGSKHRRCNMSEEWQSCCAYLPGSYGVRLHELFGVCCKAKGDGTLATPTPITEDLISLVKCYLEEQGQESKNRIANWKTVLRALKSEGALRVLGPGSHDWLHKPRCPRSLNAEPGTFPLLEADLAKWAELACRPLDTNFEMREPIDTPRASHISRLILCAATLLARIGAATNGCRLLDLLSIRAFDTWRNETDERQTTTLETIDAFIRIRCDLVGDDQVTAHLRVQRIGLRNHHALGPAAVRELGNMLECPRRIELLPAALMWIACTELLPDPGRLKVANIAVAMSAALKYALRPGDIFSLEHDNKYRLVIRTHLARAERGPVPQFEETIRLVEQRARLRDALGATRSCTIMVSNEGVKMDNQDCAQALWRTLVQFGLPLFPWQRLRDFTAVCMLLADPSAIPAVADLLEFADPIIVVLRYDEMLPRRTANSPMVLANQVRGRDGRSDR